VVDSDEASMDDAGYASDSATAASTSLTSSIRDYTFENGRRYHRFREGRYNFPNDDVEQEREDLKHAMVKLLCAGQLHFAPIGEHPQEILDIGTGTGIWAIESMYEIFFMEDQVGPSYGSPKMLTMAAYLVGDQFPSAKVVGVDLSPIQPSWVPPNVRFLVDDIESPWVYPRNHFDYIHMRNTVMAIKDWPKLLRRAFE
jgi:SAM-dependent methyltransferase